MTNYIFYTFVWLVEALVSASNLYLKISISLKALTSYGLTQHCEPNAKLPLLANSDFERRQEHNVDYTLPYKKKPPSKPRPFNARFVTGFYYYFVNTKRKNSNIVMSK